jgi:hypothetical protein
MEGPSVSAAEALKAAREAGVCVTVDRDNLVLEALMPPPRSILDDLRRCKAEIVALLRSGGRTWSAEDWQALFDETAAIRAHDGGLDRAGAERQALEEVVTEYLIRHPPLPTQPDAGCAHCGGFDGEGRVLLPVLADSGHTWVHDTCHRAWIEARSRQARDALRQLDVG